MDASTGEHGEYANARRDNHPGQGDIPADTFAVRLVLSRHHAGRLSIEKAAERCGLNSGNWVRWEDGALPRDKVEIAQAVSDGLGMDFDWVLLGGPLLSARGRPTRKAGAPARSPDTGGYRSATGRPTDTRPKGGAGEVTPHVALRRPRRIANPPMPSTDPMPLSRSLRAA